MVPGRFADTSGSVYFCVSPAWVVLFFLVKCLYITEVEAGNFLIWLHEKRDLYSG